MTDTIVMSDHKMQIRFYTLLAQVLVLRPGFP